MSPQKSSSGFRKTETKVSITEEMITDKEIEMFIRDRIYWIDLKNIPGSKSVLVPEGKKLQDRVSEGVTEGASRI
ncbi:hypothetical protein Tco_0688655 [Tanacetum coccineum]